MTLVYKAFPHEIADGCATVHCFWHNIDEQDKGAFICCLECGHVYRTARDLRRAYRRMELKSWSPEQPWLRGNEFYPSVLASLWKIATVRASRITFCQLCLHDW